MKNNWAWGGGLNREGGLINFLPLKRGGLLEGGGLFERGCLIEDLRYLEKRKCAFLLHSTKIPQDKMPCPQKEATKLEACKKKYSITLFCIYIGI